METQLAGCSFVQIQTVTKAAETLVGKDAMKCFNFVIATDMDPAQQQIAGMFSKCFDNFRDNLTHALVNPHNSPADICLSFHMLTTCMFPNTTEEEVKWFLKFFGKSVETFSDIMEGICTTPEVSTDIGALFAGADMRPGVPEGSSYIYSLFISFGNLFSELLFLSCLLSLTSSVFYVDMKSISYNLLITLTEN